MNFEIFKERLNIIKLAEAIDSKFGYDYVTSINVFLQEKEKESYVIIIAVHVDRLDKDGHTLVYMSTDHYFKVHMCDDTTISEIYLEMCADRMEVDRLSVIYDALILRLQLDFDNRPVFIERKISALTKIKAKQIDEMIELAEEINRICESESVYSSIKDLKILKELRQILRLAKEIKKGTMTHEVIGSDKHSELIAAKLRLSRIVEED